MGNFSKMAAILSRSEMCVISAVHYSDVIMSTMAFTQTVYSGADQNKHQSSASLAFVCVCVWGGGGIHQWPVNSPHKGPVTRKMFPFDDVIIVYLVPSQKVAIKFRRIDMTSLQQYLKFTGIVGVPEDKRVFGSLFNLYLESTGSLVTITYHDSSRKRHNQRQQQEYLFTGGYQTYSDGSPNPLLPQTTGMFTWNRTQTARKVGLTFAQRRDDSTDVGTTLGRPALLSRKAQINTPRPRQNRGHFADDNSNWSLFPMIKWTISTHWFG